MPPTRVPPHEVLLSFTSGVSGDAFCAVPQAVACEEVALVLDMIMAVAAGWCAVCHGDAPPERSDYH